ncbi:hypothetical protein D3C73_1343220 [compost metagenome]
MRAVFVPDLGQPEQRRDQRRNHPETEAHGPAFIEMFAQRHRRARRHGRTEAQGHGVDTGHGPGLFGEVTLDDARQQYTDHTDAGAGQYAAGEQADLAKGTAQDDPARQGQENAQHHPLRAESTRQHRRQRREQAKTKHRQGGQQPGL